MFRPAPPSVDPIPTRDSLPGYGGGFREARNVGGMTRRFSYVRARLQRRRVGPVPLMNRPVGEKPPGRRPRHNLLPTDDASNSLPSARLFACQGGESQPPLPRDSRPAPLPSLPAHQHPKLRRPVAAIGCAKPPLLEPGNTTTCSSRALTPALLQNRNKRRPTSLSPFAPEIRLSPLPKRREASLRLGRMHRQSDSSTRSCPFPSAALIISFASPASSGPAGALRLRLLPQRPFRIRSASGDRRRPAPPPTAFPPATAIRRTACAPNRPTARCVPDHPRNVPSPVSGWPTCTCASAARKPAHAANSSPPPSTWPRPSGARTPAVDFRPVHPAPCGRRDSSAFRRSPGLPTPNLRFACNAKSRPLARQTHRKHGSSRSISTRRSTGDAGFSRFSAVRLSGRDRQGLAMPDSRRSTMRRP